MVDNGAATVRAFDTASLAESPVSNYGLGYVNQAEDAAVDTRNAALYVADTNRVVKFSLATGVVEGEYPGLNFNDIVMDPARDILYGTNWNSSAVDAVDAHDGAFLGQTEGPGASEGQFLQPFGLRFTQAGLLMVGDGQQDRLELLQPIVPEPKVCLTSPLLSLQDSGAFSVSGRVEGDASVPLYPNDNVTSWSLSLGKSAVPSSFGAPALSGSGPINGALGQLDLSTQPDGVYDAVLSAETQDGLTFTANTFVSKGQFRFQASLGSPEFLSSGAAVAVEMSPGGDFLVAQPGSGTLVELDPTGLFIRLHETGLDSVDGLAVSGSTLYASSVADGVVEAYPLPATQGQGLGAPTASVGGLDMPAGLAAQGGTLYVAEYGAHDVRSYQLPGLTPSQQSPYGAAYLGLDYDVYDVAVNPVAGELYVVGDDDIVVFDLASGAWLRELAPGVGILNSLVYDAASGLIFASGAGGALYAIDPAAGGVLAQTEGQGTSEGQFIDPEGLRETAAGLLVAADLGTGRVQLLQPEPVDPSARINAPLLSLQNAGPFTVLGSVQGGSNSGLPAPFQQVTGYTLALGQTGSTFTTVASGEGPLDSAPVGSVNLSGMPDGVYSLRLSATTADSQAGGSTFVSKGRFNFQSAYYFPGVAQGYNLAVENPADDHIFVALSGTAAMTGTTMTAGLLELDAN
ncbi:MAG TPA: hypothetical protein VK786_00260, partial [bacterium]|nr:hypothetical protein [bacterium]